MSLVLWYSIHNGGDGSASPQFFESERLTEMDQELMYEGWGETCNGCLVIEGENIKITSPHVTTKAEFIEELKEKQKSKYYDCFKEEIKEFLKELE